MIDMLMADNLNTLNIESPRNAIDDFMFENGGTLFSNMFTSGPDTPRSLSEFWSGKFSYNNGCKTRAHYPGHFLNTTSLIEIMYKYGYRMRFLTNKNSFELGMYPSLLEKDIRSSDLDTFCEELRLDFSEKQFNFIYIDEYHETINHYGANKNTIRKGQNRVDKLLSDIFDNLEPDSYDLLIIFSDHGHLISRDFKSNRFSLKLKESKLTESLLTKKRLQVFHYWRFKNEQSLKIDSQLRHNVDVFPTISKLICNKEIGLTDGLNLFIDSGHQRFFVTDFLKLYADFNMSIDLWGVITSGSINIFGKNCQINTGLDDELVLIDKFDSYRTFVKENAILIKYSNYSEKLKLSKRNSVNEKCKVIVNLIKKYINNIIYF